MNVGRLRRRAVPVTVAAVLLSLTALSGPVYAAQTDPYTGGGVGTTTTAGGGGGGNTTTTSGNTTTTSGNTTTTTGNTTNTGSQRPSISLNLVNTVPGGVVRVSGCNFPANQFVRFTINPGSAQNPGTACAGAPANTGSALGDAVVQRASAGGLGLERLRFELVAQAANSCAYGAPVSAVAPDTTAGGGFASTRADTRGCVDSNVTIPSSLGPGSYEVCAASTGLETVCATLQLASASGSTASRGFARTGLDLLPYVVGALLAIAIGRYLVRRSRRMPA